MHMYSRTQGSSMFFVVSGVCVCYVNNEPVERLVKGACFGEVHPKLNSEPKLYILNPTQQQACRTPRQGACIGEVHPKLNPNPKP